ncbi:MAG: hypothetical protein AB8F34_13565 [Akkermansiaceae bacterium]
MPILRTVLHYVLAISIIMVYGFGSVVAFEIKHSHEHVHAAETEHSDHSHHDHHHHGHEPLNDPAENQNEQGEDQQEDPHSSSHSHFVSIDAGTMINGTEPVFLISENRASHFFVRLDNGCPDGPCFSLIKPPQ